MNYLISLAYIDPGTGSIILQGVVAFFMGIAIFFGVLKGKIMALFGKKIIKDAEEHKNPGEK